MLALCYTCRLSMLLSPSLRPGTRCHCVSGHLQNVMSSVSTSSAELLRNLSFHSQVLSRHLRLTGDFDFRSIAKLTPGFVGADLAALLKEAAAIAVTRIFDQLGPCEQPPSTLSAVAGGVPPQPRWALCHVTNYVIGVLQLCYCYVTPCMKRISCSFCACRRDALAA